MPEFTYTFDPRLRGGAGAYRNNQTGRVVKLTEARAALDAAIDNSIDGTRQLGMLLRDRVITLADWQLQMRTTIKNVNVSAAVLGNGGYEFMTPSAWGRVGQIVKKQYALLDNFAAQIASGEQPLDGRFLQRASMYNDAAVSTYHTFERFNLGIAGFDEERSILDPGAKHCPECPAEAAKGWQPIGSLIPIGERTCLALCRCTMEYRNTVTDETVT